MFKTVSSKQVVRIQEVLSFVEGNNKLDFRRTNYLNTKHKPSVRLARALGLRVSGCRAAVRDAKVVGFRASGV